MMAKMGINKIDKRKLYKNQFIADGSLEFKYNYFFPKIFNSNKLNFKKNVAVIGIGGNLGNVEKKFKQLILNLKSNKHFLLLQTAPILKNPPFGYLEQNDFLNSIVVFGSNLNAQNILNYLLKIEKRFGRKRAFKNSPRTIDLDIIFFNNHKINKNNLTVPHPKWSQRISVVLPLSCLKEPI